MNPCDYRLPRKTSAKYKLRGKNIKCILQARQCSVVWRQDFSLHGNTCRRSNSDAGIVFVLHVLELYNPKTKGLAPRSSKAVDAKCAITALNQTYTQWVCYGTVGFTALFPLQASNGGVFRVLEGATATFNTKILMVGNGVSDGYSGGAVYTDGKVSAGGCSSHWE